MTSVGALRSHVDEARPKADAAARLKVGLYLQSDAAGLGGSEYWLSFLAEALSQHHDVTLLHHKAGVTVEQLAAFTGTDLHRVKNWDDLSGVRSSCYPDDALVSEKSAAFDLFVTITHRVPPVCQARVGVLIVLFPFEPEPDSQLWPWSESADWRSPRAMAQRAYHGWLWRRRFDSYQVRTSLSAFTQRWVQRLWNVDTDVMYPPSDTSFPDLAKTDTIASVGRFAGAGVTSKAQLELVGLFRSRITSLSPAWSYVTLGASGGAHADEDYLGRVRDAAAGGAVRVVADASRSEVKATLGHAKIFWHAVGFDVDEERTPQRCEHFGYVTVEAMAAGAVPVVIGRGGPGEVVRHGVDGFLCVNLDEIGDRTAWLIEHPDRLAEMSAEARRRSSDFALARSLETFRSLIAAKSGVTV